MSNVHCHHIILGASANNAHAQLLKPFSLNAKVANKITLLKGPPFATEEMAAMALKFNTFAFEGVFRKVKVPTK